MCLVPLPPPHTKELKKYEVTQALGMAKKATASVGKFTPALVISDIVYCSRTALGGDFVVVFVVYVSLIVQGTCA